MHVSEKSDLPIVAMKSANNPANGGAESMERRGGTKGNAEQLRTCRTQGRASVTQRLGGVRKVARERKKEKFTALLHHLDVSLLREAYYELRRNAASGVDGQTWRDYGQELEKNLESLRARVHGGIYRPKPSRRTYIAKADGSLRPLGVASLEDKVLQRAVVKVLEPIYESDFKGFSYGFRPGRGQHDALDALAVGIHRRHVNWILDADLRKFFDSVDHSWLMRFVGHRIGDNRVLRLIWRWLKAGAMEAGTLIPTEEGTPQGAVISPLLANIYLHYAFDLWASRWREKEAQGPVMLVRYADDFVVGFCRESDARRFRSELEERLGRFGLELHPEKTRLIEFGRFAEREHRNRGEGKPESFCFLGLRHICSRPRNGVGFLLKRQSNRERMRSKLRSIKEELGKRMHLGIRLQGKWLGRVVRGWFNYHAVPTNIGALMTFYEVVQHLWWRLLRRRSQRDRTHLAKVRRLATEFLPKPRILHPWPEVRLAAIYPRWEPGA
jgi:RNA-directed DNA polymerase